ncbi:MAG: PepSY-like domain-containing protein [Maribacter sp.]
MKRIKFFGVVVMVAVIGLGIYAFYQRTDPPQKVKDAFTKKFPMVKKVKWEKESDTEWEAEFKMGGTEYSANFLEDGTWKETEHEINKKEVPANVIMALETKFPEYKIEEAEISETNESRVYELEIEKGDSEIELVMDMKGRIVKKEIIKVSEDKD